LRHRDEPYVNAELFEDYLRNVFLPQLMITRIVKDLPEEDAALLMDSCSSHSTLSVIELLSTARVRVVIVTFAPHTTYHPNLPRSQFDLVWRSEKTRSVSIAPRGGRREYPIHHEGASLLPDDDEDG
jgi:hypothetical protein